MITAPRQHVLPVWVVAVLMMTTIASRSILEHGAGVRGPR